MNRFQRSRAAAALAFCGVMTAGGIQAQESTAAPRPPQGPAAAQTTTVPVNRAARDTWTRIMEVLKPSRTAAVTDAQLQRLRELPVEAREMMAAKKYRARDIYPKLSPELEKLFEEWKKTHKKEGVKPNVGG